MRISDWSSDVCSSDLLGQQLAEAGVDVVQVHRSYVVNRDKVAEVAPLRDGDFRIRMADGSDLRGSRRFRHLLDRKSVVSGQSVSVRVDLGGRRIIKKKKKHNTIRHNIAADISE